MRRFKSILGFKDIFNTTLMVVGLLLIGTIGFMLIEGHSLTDALYMTVITASTVGYREVSPPSDAGKWFTMFIIIYSIIVIGYAATHFSRLLLDGYFRQKLKDYNVKKQITKLKDHVIVCGYGRNGFQACEELADHNIDFIVIEKRDHVVERIRENPERLFIQGDAASEDVLNEAQIHNAKALITALTNDADNIYVVLTARELNPSIKIISRASDFKSDTKLRRAGADNVIMPDRIGGQRMAKLVAQPDVVEFWEYVLLQSAKDVNLEMISCELMSESTSNTRIKDIGLREKTGVNIVGVKTEEGSFIFNPSAEFELTPTDQLFVLGSPEQIKKVKNTLQAM
jgi:voltage-gated potassium channel